MYLFIPISSQMICSSLQKYNLIIVENQEEGVGWKTPPPQQAGSVQILLCIYLACSGVTSPPRASFLPCEMRIVMPTWGHY